MNPRTKIPEERWMGGEINDWPARSRSGTSLAERIRTCRFDVVETVNRVKSLGTE